LQGICGEIEPGLRIGQTIISKERVDACAVGRTLVIEDMGEDTLTEMASGVD
jgi:hypothetical protein